MKTMSIKVITKEVFGKTLIYPNCEMSKRLASLARTKTLTLENLKTIRYLGYSIEISHLKKNEIYSLCNK